MKSNPANKAAHIEAQAAMRRLQQRDFLNKNTDGVDTYMSMDKVSKTEKLRSVSDMMYKIAQNTPLSKGKMAEFAQHPLMDLRERSTRETFGVDNSYKYWNDKAEGMHYALKEFTAAQRAIADHPGTSNEERSAILSDIGTLEETVKLADKGLTRLAQGPNFSLGRIGNFFASAMLKLNSDSSIDRQALAKVQDHLAEFGVVVPLNTERGNIFMRVETEAQRDSLLVKMRELQAQGHLRADADTDTGSALKFGKRGDAAAIQLSKDIAPWLASFEASIRNNPDYTDASRKQLMEDMHSHMLDQMPDNSLAKFMAPRKSVGGFDANMIDSFMRRTRAANDAFVGRALSPMMADATAHMESRLDALERAPTGSDATKQADIARDVLDEVRKRDLVIGQYTQTPVLDVLRRITNSFALGGVISYPVVQLTQVGMVALPKLGAVHGFVKASKALARNTIEAARITGAMFSQGMDAKGLSRAQRLARASNVEVSLEALQRTGISTRKAEYLMHLNNAGQLGTGSQAHLLVAASEGKTDGAFNHTMQYAASLGYYAETFTRILTGLAHLDLMGPDISPRDASVGGIALNKASLFDYHQDVQGRGFGKQGIYGKSTPLMTQFMTYQSNMVQRLYLDVHKAFIDKTATPEEARQARAFLMQHAAMTAMFAGTLGMPFATAFAAAYDKLKDLMDGDEHPSDIRSDYRNYLANMFGKDAAEVIAKGGFRLAGVDMTNRIGEQDLLPFSKFISDRRALKDQFKDLEARSWGAPINLAINAIRGADKLMDGDVLGGLATMMPAAISGPIKAYRMTQDGYVDANGNKLPISTPSSEATLAQLLGFTPSAKAEYSEASLAQSQQKAILHNKGMSLSNQITQALQSGDHATARDAIAQTIAFDKANPTYAVLPALKSKMTSQAKSGAVASALHTPLGVNPRDLAGQSLTQYANY